MESDGVRWFAVAQIVYYKSSDFEQNSIRYAMAKLAKLQKILPTLPQVSIKVYWLAHFQLGNLVWELCLRVWRRSSGSRKFMWLMWIFFFCGCLKNYQSCLFFFSFPFFLENHRWRFVQAYVTLWKQIFANWHSRNYNGQFSSARVLRAIGKKDLGSIFFLRPFLLD